MFVWGCLSVTARHFAQAVIQGAIPAVCNIGKPLKVEYALSFKMITGAVYKFIVSCFISFLKQ